MIRPRHARLLVLAALLQCGATSASATDRAPVGITWAGAFPGARATAMGTADVAGGRGPEAIFLNTAPLRQGADLAFNWGQSDFIPGSDLENLAMAGELGNWRLTIASTSTGLTNLYDQADYDPTLSSGLIDFKERTLMGGVAYDLGSVLSKAHKTALVVGAAVRRVDSKLGGWNTGATGLDLGVTVASTSTSAGSRREVAFAVNSQNLTDARLDGDADGGFLMKRTQLATTLNWAQLRGPQGEERFSITAAAGYEFRSQASDVLKVGMEFVLARFLAGRLGTNTAVDPRTFFWGLGLNLDTALGETLDLSFDWGRTRYGSDAERAQRDMWSIRFGMDFN